MSVDEISVVKMTLDKMSVDKISVQKMSVEKMSVNNAQRNIICKINLCRQNVCRQNVCRWNVSRRNIRSQNEMQRQVFVGNKTVSFESNLSQVERENGYFYRKKTFSFFSLKYLLIEGKNRWQKRRHDILLNDIQHNDTRDTKKC
jgi:hypothetical protein